MSCRLSRLGALAAVVGWACFVAVSSFAANPSGDLRVEVIAAYNLVVDSNVESPSTYAPRSAYLGATFYNDGANDLTNVYAFIGNYINGTNDTPGIYPSRIHTDPLTGVTNLVGPLAGGAFALTHQGGSAGTADATRYVGTIPAGGSITVYWLISYPNVDTLGHAVWGPSIKPYDDLWLNYDIWAKAMDAGVKLTADVTRKVTMRNEISAAANKIYPNGANKVPDAYKVLLQQYVPSWTNLYSDGTPGTRIWTEGIWYDLGNVGEGFDNNGDLVPDRNAWMQPVGDPTIFDSSAFRLVKTSAMVVVKLKSGGEQVYIVENQLYFENIPENNGAVGLVRYEFLPLKSGMSTLSPYQEVASGFDNEKFNGDYGATLGGPLSSGTSKVEMDKSANRVVQQPGGTIRYTITFTNTGTLAVGDPSTRMPLVIQDKIPTGTTYVAGSATSSNTLPSGVASYTVLYSTNNGVSWQSAQPAAASVTHIQWWLSDALGAAKAGIVGFTVTVKNPYTYPSPLIVNTGGLSFGNASPFVTDWAGTMVLGTNRIGDTVFLDDGAGGGIAGNGSQETNEAGIVNVTVRLYYDANSNGVADASETLLATQSTGANGKYLFTGLPDGRYVAQVDAADPDIPTGSTATRVTSMEVPLDPTRATSNMVTYLNADFAFLPCLGISKVITAGSPLREGRTVTYSITVTNRIAGNGGLTQYSLWATNKNTAKSAGTVWTGETNAYKPAYPNGVYATVQPQGNSDALAVDGFSRSSFQGNPTKVELIIPLKIDPPWNNDTLKIEFYTNVANTASFTTSGVASAFATGDFVRNLTSLRTWLTTQFAAGNPMVIVVTGAKVGVADGGILGFDQAGLRVTTDWIAGSTNNALVLDPVPAYDTYDADIFQLVSASPSVSSTVTSGVAPNKVGTLTWSNLGPLYPGGFKTATATFNILEPPGNSSVTITNVGSTTGAKYRTGTSANSATSKVISTVSPAGTIGDFIWRDLDGDGIQDGGTETGIAGVSVVIRPPAGVDVGRGAGQPVTNVTDSTGYYFFKGLPATGIYTVSVVTATLPGGSGTCTKDRDGNNNSITPVAITNNSTTGGDLVLNADFGYQVSTIINGTVWHDVNASATPSRDSGENWLTNVTVYLFAGTNVGPPSAAIRTNRTDRNGYFQFVGSFNGTYTIQVTTNTGMMAGYNWTQTYDTDGIGSRSFSRTTVVTGGSGRGDFSYRRVGTYTIGDTLFYDWNGNGVQNATNDEGVANVTVRLYEDEDGDGVVDDGVDALIRTTSTSGSGSYTFAEVLAAKYIVVVDGADPDMPSSYTITADPSGASDGRSMVTITTSNRLDQDFGYKPLGSGSIGDTVWKDVNGDGVQSGSQETGIANIKVTLQVDLNKDGTYVTLRSTQTDATGKYLFSNLPDGSYRVVVDTTDTDLPKDAFGYRYVPTTLTTRSATLSGGNSVLTVDFGFAALGAIGDTIFWDSNQNGGQDWSEAGIPGVTNKLYRDTNGNRLYDAGEPYVTNAVTDADGRYLFTGLTTGRYVVVVQKAGLIATATLMSDPDADGLPATDPLATGVDGQYGVRVYPGTSFMGADFGYVPPGVLGDTLWIDTDNDGIKDASETGLPFITVQLYSNVTLKATTETDADGYYLFSNVGNGTWTVKVATNDTDFPADLAASYDVDGTPNSQTPSIVISGGHVTSINGVAKTNADFTIDFGYRFSGVNTLSGTVGLDGTPTNGVLGAGVSGVSVDEVPYAGIMVYLSFWDDDGDGVIEAGEARQIAATTTSTNGDYSFAGLPTGDGNDKYIVSLSAPEGDIKLTTVTGNTPAFRVVETPDVEGATVSAYQAVNVAAAVTNMDFAFRMLLAYDFGDLPSVYGTRIQDALDGARHLVKATPTLRLGASVDTESNGQPTVDASGDGGDEDGVSVLGGVWVNSGTGQVQVTTGLGSGWLVGFIDFNRDGDLSDPGEMVVNRAVAAGAGGTTTNRFTVPAGTFATTNATQLYARFRLFATAPTFPQFVSYGNSGGYGEVEDYRFSFAAIGNLVWRDMDGDGVLDAGEQPIPGARVYVDVNGDGVRQSWEPSCLTGTNGTYGIGGLRTGTYTVRVETNTLPAYVTPGWDLDGTGTAHRASVAVTNGQFRTDADFGYRPMAIGGTAWYDTNQDGVQNEGPMTGVSNILVRLYNATTNWIATTTTRSDGSYYFAVATPGNYFVEFYPVGYRVSPRDQGGNDTLDSDVPTNAPYRTIMTTISAGEFDMTWDTGLYRPPNPNSIGNYVWFDTDQDGTQDTNETGQAGVTVRLYTATTSLVAQTTTDIQGYYYFAGIAAGSYKLQFVQPVGYGFTASDQGNDALDSDANTNTGFTASFSMATNTVNYNWDAGVTRAVDLVVRKAVNGGVASEGDTVWFTVTASNSGPGQATEVRFTDTWPATLTLVSATPGQGTFTMSNRVWNVGTMNAGASASLILTGTVQSATAGKVITNRVQLSNSRERDVVSSNNSAKATLTVRHVDLVVRKTVNNNNPYVGSNIVYTISVSNKGPYAATAVSVSEPLTNGLTYVSAVPGQGTYNSTTKVWTVGALAVNATASLALTAQVGAGTGGKAITNQSRLTASTPTDTVASNNSAKAVITVRGADLVIRKTPDNAQPNIGSTVIYTIVVSNKGPNAATGVTAKEPLTNSLGYVSHTVSQGSYTYPGGTWTVGTLAVNSSATLRVTTTVNPGMGIVWITNRSVITASSLPDPVTSNNTAQAVLGISNMQIKKTSNGGASVYPGSNITYTIVVTNDGVPPHYNVVVTDSVPAGVTYVAGSAQVTLPYTTNRYASDRFNTIAYTNSNGTIPWSAAWSEIGEADGVSAGSVRVLADGTNANVVRINSAGYGLFRRANLGSYFLATLSFTYRREALDNTNDYVAVQVTTNAGTGPWTEVARIAGSVTTDPTYQSWNSISISSYLATNTGVRFVSSGMGPSDYVYVDNVRIDASARQYRTVSTNGPAVLVYNAYLREDEYARITYQVKVPTNPAVLAITNRVSVKSDQMQFWRHSTVTDQVHHVNVGVTKTVNDEHPGASDDIWFTIVVTNKGKFAATGVQVRDYWRTNQLIFVSASPSQGTYNTNNPVSHLWTVGNLAVGGSARVVITGQVNVAGKNIWITNRTSVTAVDQYDVIKSDNNSQVGLLTVVVLSRFESFASGGSTWVEWETASENETEAFRLYRQDAEGAPWVPVTSRRIRAVPGSPQGGIYRVQDSPAVPGTARRYRLVEIERGGRELEYGPFDVVVQRAPAGVAAPDRGIEVTPRVSAASAARFEERVAVEQARPARRAAPAATAWGRGGSGEGEGDLPRLKLTTREAGIHYVSAARLAEPLGLLENVIRTRIGNGAVNVRNRGQPVAWRAAPTNAGIYFLAEPLRTAYTEENVYWVTWSTGLQVQATSMTNPPAPVEGRWFRDRAAAEEDAYSLTAFFEDPDADFWLWEYVGAGDPEYDAALFTLRVPGPVVSPAQAASLRVRLQGATETGVPQEHHVQVRVNNTLVGEDWWEGAVAHTALLAVSQALLVDGDNDIEIKAVLDPGIEDSLFYVDSLEMDYARFYRSDGGPLSVVAETNEVVTVSGFGSALLEVWRAGDPLNPCRVDDVTIDADGGGHRVSFRPAASNTPYWVFDRTVCATVQAIRVAEPVALGAATNGAGYVVITVPALEPAATALANSRAARGLSARVVYLDSIYDAFNNGIVHPVAIRAFLHAAWTNWSVPPRYAVLAGSGTYDHRNCKGLGENLVPVRLVTTPQGLFSSDGWYADFDDDAVPEIAIGRIPALTSPELQRVVDKMARTENAEPGEWLRRVLLVTDDGDDGGDFPVSGEAVAGRCFEGDYRVDRVACLPDSVADSRNRLFAAWNEGALFVNYFGHGGIDRMASEGLVTAADAGLLVNSNRLPVVTGMTCLMGRFDIPGFDCLGESLLLDPDGGASAVWSPVGLSLNPRAEQLGRRFYQAILDGETDMLGDAVLTAMEAYRASGSIPYVLRVFNLLGDPALKIPGMAAWKHEVPLARWKQTVFPHERVVDPGVSANDADPDVDGLDNVAEFALGRDPMHAETSSVLELLDAPLLGIPTYDVVLTYRRSKLATGTECRLEVSPDLMAWTTGAGYVTDTDVVDDGNGQTETVRFYVRNPDPESGPCFIRLRVIYLP